MLQSAWRVGHGVLHAHASRHFEMDPHLACLDDAAVLALFVQLDSSLDHIHGLQEACVCNSTQGSGKAF